MPKITEALLELRKGKKAKFDETIEVHMNLDLDVNKQEQMIRYSFTLPNGTGKVKKIAVYSTKKVPTADLELVDEDLAKIESGKLAVKTHFDVLICEPKMMAKLAKVARVLGPQGVMPNPKNGTVTEDIEKAVEQFRKGKIEVKHEQKLPIIHTIIGKLSFEDKKLIENFEELLASLKQNKPQKVKPTFIKSIFISTSMGNSIAVDLE